MTANRRPPTLSDRLARPFQRFLAIEAASTILLLLATVLALAWANSPWRESYTTLWHTKLGIRLGGAELALTLEHWVNDGLMALFFFLVGMEIKHEIVHGELSSRGRAMLPVFGALGGMLAPAAIYAAFHASGPAASGWGVPMATDIAFAVAALAVFGPRVPPGLKVFLLALAIVDDLGAVTVIALFYTHGLSLPALAAAGGGLAVVWTYCLMHLAGLANRHGLRRMADLVRRWIPIARIEQGVSQLLRARFRLVVTEVGGCAVDVDNEHDFEVARERYAEWTKAQRERALALCPPPPGLGSGAG